MVPITLFSLEVNIEVGIKHKEYRPKLVDYRSASDWQHLCNLSHHLLPTFALHHLSLENIPHVVLVT